MSSAIERFGPSPVSVCLAVFVLCGSVAGCGNKDTQATQSAETAGSESTPAAPATAVADADAGTQESDEAEQDEEQDYPSEHVFHAGVGYQYRSSVAGATFSEHLIALEPGYRYGGALETGLRGALGVTSNGSMPRVDADLLTRGIDAFIRYGELDGVGFDTAVGASVGLVVVSGTDAAGDDVAAAGPRVGTELLGRFKLSGAIALDLGFGATYRDLEDLPADVALGLRLGVRWSSQTPRRSDSDDEVRIYTALRDSVAYTRDLLQLQYIGRAVFPQEWSELRRYLVEPGICLVAVGAALRPIAIGINLPGDERPPKEHEKPDRDGQGNRVQDVFWDHRPGAVYCNVPPADADAPPPSSRVMIVRGRSRSGSAEGLIAVHKVPLPPPLRVQAQAESASTLKTCTETLSGEECCLHHIVVGHRDPRNSDANPGGLRV